MAERILPGSLRGIDPTWHELDHEFATILLRALCDDVVAVLKHHKEITGTIRDLRTEGVALDDWGQAVFVFQLDGHDWTQISGPSWWLGNAELVAALSKRLRTTAFQHLGEGVYQGYDMHGRFEAGKPVESSSEIDAEGVASELGLYVAHEVWGEENGRVTCMKEGWEMSDFRGAQVLMLKS